MPDPAGAADGAREEIAAFLRESGLVAPGAELRLTALSGGVSSDIWLAEGDGRPVCVKRALAKLKVRADWYAPVERNAYEVSWMRIARALAPGSAPQVLAHDPARGAFAMDYLDPRSHPVWKGELRAGRADERFAASAGRVLARIHAGTAGDADVAARFATDRIFHDIRLEPYLAATARAHPDRADALLALVERTARTKRALVHGDVSPKNVLVSPDGVPVFLDAECAWYGDPAFDLAFCCNHLLLKCLWTPAAREGFLACFDALAAAYLAGVSWEPPQALESRAAQLLPGLLLGRVDGKSPVEYLTGEGEREVVRRTARALLARAPQRLADVVAAWREEIRRHGGAA